MLLESGNYLLKVLCNCNRRQNQLRHFALNGLFDVFRSSKGEKIAFPPPYPPCNVVPLSLQFCRRLSESQKWPHILKKINLNYVFLLGCKTPGGFLFAMFNVVMPIWEQLEYGDFVIFSAWHFVSRLSCLDIVRCGASRTISILSFIETKYKVNRTENENDFWAIKQL